MRTARFLVRAIAALELWAAAPAVLHLTLAPARAAAADEAWKPEFEEICSKTQDAMVLSADELRTLVARCDKLKPAVDALEESLRKVYARKLKACRDLYQFVLETREPRG